MVQLRDAQNQVATLQATQTMNEQKIKELTAKADALTKQAVADRNTSTNMIAELNTKLAEQTTVNQGLQAAIDKSQEFVTGSVRLKLYKGNVAVVGRSSPYSLYDQDLVTFEEGKVAYDQRDAAGFIRLNALRLRTLGQRRKNLEK